MVKGNKVTKTGLQNVIEVLSGKEESIEYIISNISDEEVRKYLAGFRDALQYALHLLSKEKMKCEPTKSGDMNETNK